MSALTLTDEAGSYGSAPAGTQQISSGSATWDTCVPAMHWVAGTWSPGELVNTTALLYSMEDWVFSGTFTMIWRLSGSAVRTEVRTLSLLNGATVSDSITINGSPAALALSALSSVTLATTTYIFTPVQYPPYTPTTATFHKPTLIDLTFIEDFFNQSSLTYDDFEMVGIMSLFSVYRGFRNASGTPVAVDTGDVGSIVWDIFRSASGSPYGLAWEDCGGGGGGGGAENCVYAEDPATTCAYAEDPSLTCTYAEDAATICVYSEDM